MGLWRQIKTETKPSRDRPDAAVEVQFSRFDSDLRVHTLWCQYVLSLDEAKNLRDQLDAQIMLAERRLERL